MNGSAASHGNMGSGEIGLAPCVLSACTGTVGAAAAAFFLIHLWAQAAMPKVRGWCAWGHLGLAHDPDVLSHSAITSYMLPVGAELGGKGRRGRGSDPNARRPPCARVLLFCSWKRPAAPPAAIPRASALSGCPRRAASPLGTCSWLGPSGWARGFPGRPNARRRHTPGNLRAGQPLALAPPGAIPRARGRVAPPSPHEAGRVAPYEHCRASRGVGGGERTRTARCGVRGEALLSQPASA